MSSLGEGTLRVETEAIGVGNDCPYYVKYFTRLSSQVFSFRTCGMLEPHPTTAR